MMNIISILGGVRATVFAAVALCALLFSGVQTHRLDTAQDKLADIELAKSKANEEHQRELRKKEAEMARALLQVATKSIQEQKDAKATHDKLRADLRSGERRMHERFKCPRLPAGAGTPPRVDGEERTGLLTEDGEFLISEAHRADLIAIERNELIDVVHALRKILNERR